MFPQPTMAALTIEYYQLEMENQAQNERLRREVCPKVQVVKQKAPTRVPRTWRWRYLWAK
jgi:hypothetical protein